MSYPERVPLDPPQLDLWNYGKLTFYQPDTTRFPCLGLAYEALKRGGTLPAVLNAANEVAVEAFLNSGISFVDIAQVIDQTMNAATPQTLTCLDDALEADRWAREKAESCIHSLAS